MKNKLTVLALLVLFVTGMSFAQTVSLSVAPASIAENGGVSTITATASVAPAAGVTITVTITPTGTATGGGVDYTLSSTTITIVGNGANTTGIATITSVPDALLEGNQTVLVDITGVSDDDPGNDWTSAGVQQTVTLTDQVITLSLLASPLAENGGVATFRATSTTPVTGAVTVSLSWGGSATLTSDYTKSATDITIANGTTTGDVTVTGVSDVVLDPAETIIATITGSTQGALGVTLSQTATITDQVITLSLLDSPLAENGGVATFRATSTTPVTGAVTVSLSWGGTATLTSDYTKSAVDITIANGTTTGDVTVTGVSDLALDAAETIIGTITASTQGALGVTLSQTATITDDELQSDFILTPVNGLTGVSILPTFTWTTQSADDDLGYHIYISTSGASQASFESNVIVTTTAANEASTASILATLANTPLSNGTLYYVQIVAHKDANVNRFSNIYHFTTYTDVTVYQSWPYDGATVAPSPVIFSWYIGSSTTGLKFNLQYKQTAAAPAAESDWSGTGFVSVADQTSLTKTINNLVGGKPYYWRVIVKKTNNDIVKYSSTFSFFTSGGSSVTLYPSYPTGNTTTYTLAPTLYWYADQYVTGVKYQVKYTTDGTDVTSDGILDDVNTLLPLTANLVAQGSSNLYKALPTLSDGIQYYWQVRAYYAAGDNDGDPATNEGSTDYGWTNWSSIESFTTYTLPTSTPPVPVISYPTTGVIVYTTNPSIYWYLGAQTSSGLKFQLIVSSTNDADADLTDETIFYNSGTTYATALTTLYKAVSGLTPGQTYYCQVRSTYVGGAGVWSDWSSIESFTVTGGITNSYPVASYPVGNPTVYTLTPTLYWYLEGSSLGLDGYYVRLEKTAQPGTFLGYNDYTYTVTGAANTYKTIPSGALNYGDVVYWAVAAYSGLTTGATYSEGSFTVVGGAGSGELLLTYPYDGASTTGTSTTLYWYYNGYTTGITGYKYLVSSSDVFANTIATGTTASASVTSKTITGLVGGTTYYWKIVPMYGAVEGTWSDDWQFTVIPGSANIVQPLVGGPNNVQINSVSPQLSWVLPVQSAANSSYEVQLAENANFANAKSLKSDKPSLNVSGLAGGKTYFWKVRATDKQGVATNYSSVAKFSINAVTAVEEKETLPTEFELGQNYPNPFNPTTLISYALPQNAFVTLKVYDMLGREVKTLVSKEVAAGNYSVDWKGDDNFGNKVATGAYVYRITAGDFVSVKKMLLIK